MTAAEIVTTDGRAQLEALDPAAREVAVTAYLAQARDQLAHAVEMTGPAAVAAIKAEIATAAEATKQLGLSREIQGDAQEMVRRAEYALDKAMRLAQERGQVASISNNPNAGPKGPYVRVRNGVEEHVQAPLRDQESSLPSPSAFFKNNQEWTDVRAMGAATETEFEAALADAKVEGNLSRANVLRKVKGIKDERLTPVEKLTAIRKHADTGMTSGQIATEIGASEAYVRNVARTNDIKITADELLRGTHRRKVDYDHVIGHLVMSLEVLTQGLDDIDVDTLDDVQMQNWTDSLTTTTRALNRFVKQMKEKVQ